jgi:thiaminase/transcriptional activator TenA
MSWVTSLRTAQEPLYRAIRRHPFVEGIARGTLPKAAAIFYVQQDVQYLATYARMFGVAIAQSEDLSQMKRLAAHMTLLLEGELLPHQCLCRSAQVSYEDLKRTTVAVAPAAHHYAQHMLATGARGVFAQTIAAILPCHWVYVDLGRDLEREFGPGDHHPFRDWIAFYARPSMREGLEDLCDLLEQSSGTGLDRAIAQAFNVSFAMEYRFFDMAWHQAGWQSFERPEGLVSCTP